MRFLLAPDKYKGSLTAIQVVQAMAEGIALVDPRFESRLLPLADGGDGTEEILRHHLQGREVIVQVHDPLMRPIQAGYTLSADGSTAIIEMARASGLALLADHERNCLHTSTYGTGELMAHALQQGARRLILGIGGSATSEGGIGMAAALGFRLLDETGQVVTPVGENLERIHRIEWPEAPLCRGVRIEVACDVTNPLLGADGAAAIYGPQKGADPKAVAQLEAGLSHLDRRWEAQLGRSYASIPGAGAAGGLGGGLMAFLGAELRSGIELVMREARFDAQLAQADLVLTGEGRLDGQTLAGKVIQGVCQAAHRYQKPVIAICGALAISPEQQRELGLVHASSVTPAPMPLQEALPRAYEYVVRETFSVVNLVKQLQPK
jgi:glycerate 2-kinase